jgi:hypothetical protein
VRKEFGGVVGLSVSPLRLVPTRSSSSRVLLRFLWLSTSNSSNIVIFVLQVCDSLLSTLILVALGLK